MLRAFGAFAGSFVDYAAVFCLHFCQSVGDTVFDGECDVLDASAAAVVGDELRDCAVLRGAFEKLELGLADFEEGCAHFLVCYFFDSEAFETENVFVERNGFVE